MQAWNVPKKMCRTKRRTNVEDQTLPEEIKIELSFEPENFYVLGNKNYLVVVIGTHM